MDQPSTSSTSPRTLDDAETRRLTGKPQHDLQPLQQAGLEVSFVEIYGGGLVVPPGLISDLLLAGYAQGSGLPSYTVDRRADCVRLVIQAEPLGARGNGRAWEGLCKHWITTWGYDAIVLLYGSGMGCSWAIGTPPRVEIAEEDRDVATGSGSNSGRVRDTQIHHRFDDVPIPDGTIKGVTFEGCSMRQPCRPGSKGSSFGAPSPGPLQTFAGDRSQPNAWTSDPHASIADLLFAPETPGPSIAQRRAEREAERANEQVRAAAARLREDRSAVVVDLASRMSKDVPFHDAAPEPETTDEAVPVDKRIYGDDDQPKRPGPVSNVHKLVRDLESDMRAAAALKPRPMTQAEAQELYDKAYRFAADRPGLEARMAAEGYDPITPADVEPKTPPTDGNVVMGMDWGQETPEPAYFLKQRSGPAAKDIITEWKLEFELVEPPTIGLVNTDICPEFVKQGSQTYSFDRTTVDDNGEQIHHYKAIEPEPTDVPVMPEDFGPTDGPQSWEDLEPEIKLFQVWTPKADRSSMLVPVKIGYIRYNRGVPLKVDVTYLIEDEVADKPKSTISVEYLRANYELMKEELEEGDDPSTSPSEAAHVETVRHDLATGQRWVRLDGGSGGRYDELVIASLSGPTSNHVMAWWGDNKPRPESVRIAFLTRMYRKLDDRLDHSPVLFGDIWTRNNTGASPATSRYDQLQIIRGVDDRGHAKILYGEPNDQAQTMDVEFLRSRYHRVPESSPWKGISSMLEDEATVDK